MTKLDLSLNLPDRLAQEARDAGLLAPAAMAEMLADGVRRKAAERIRNARSRATSAEGEAPLSLAALQAKVAEVRADRA